MSEKIFDRYLKALDPERLFFTQADIDSFADARTRLDDAILRGNLSAPFAMFQRYEQRVTERLTYARGSLGQGFDFSTKEAYAYARDKAPWPPTRPKCAICGKRVKNDWLPQARRQDDKAIRDTLAKRYDNYRHPRHPQQERRRLPDLHERLRHVDRAPHQLPGP